MFKLEENKGIIYLLKYCAMSCSVSECIPFLQPLPNNIRPLYTTSMKNLVISFSGFRVKEELVIFILYTSFAMIDNCVLCNKKKYFSVFSLIWLL